MENMAYPQLVFIHGEKHENQVFCDVLSEKTTSTFTRKIPEFMIETPIWLPTNHPYWLMLVSSTPPRLWNPVTLQLIDLPVRLEIKSAECIRHVFLTKTINHPDCMILLWMRDFTILFSYVNRDDHDQTWTRKDYVEEVVEVGSGDNFAFDDFRHPITCHDYYSMFSLSNSIMLNIETAVKPLVIRPVKYKILYSYDLCGPHSHTNLVACCGELFMIKMNFSRVRDEIESVIVLKLDFSDMSWNLVESCPNAAFFISGDQTLSCPVSSADSSRVGNRVYFTNFSNDDVHKKCLYTYHIQQKKLKVSLLDTPSSASKPYWIQVSDSGALKKVEEKYHSGEDGIEERNTCDELLISNVNNNGEYHETVLSDIPVEILRIIASYLTNPVDYLSFRAVSKFCCSIGSAKEWRNILGHIDDGNEEISGPWLMAPSLLHQGVYSMVDPVTCNKYYTVIPETLDKYSSMCYSSNGMILMHKEIYEEDRRENALQMWLYNPLTKYTTCLPKSPKNLEHLLVKPNSVVVGARLEHFADLFYTVNGESTGELEWDGGRFTEEHEESKSMVRQSNVNIVCVGDFYYLLVENGNLVYFSDEENLLKTHYLKQPCKCDSFQKIFLVECDGDILSIYVGNEWKWMRVFKFNRSELVWEEVKDLKNNNLYVSNTSSIVMKGRSHETGNRIYFPRFYQDSFIYYSLNTNKFHVRDGRDSVMDNYYGTEEQLYSCWFLPTFN